MHLLPWVQLFSNVSFWVLKLTQCVPSRTAYPIIHRLPSFLRFLPGVQRAQGFMIHTVSAHGAGEKFQERSLTCRGLSYKGFIVLSSCSVLCASVTNVLQECVISQSAAVWQAQPCLTRQITRVNVVYAWFKLFTCWY